MKDNRRNIYLEDFIVGNKLKSPSYTVPKQESIKFAKHWDPQPFHINEAVAEQTHGKLTDCSAYIFATFCKVSNGLYENANVQAIAGFGFDEMRIFQPLFVEDTVHVESEISANRRSKSKPDRGIVTSLNKMYNQNGELVFSVISTVMILDRKLPEYSSCRWLQSAPDHSSRIGPCHSLVVAVNLTAINGDSPTGDLHPISLPDYP